MNKCLCIYNKNIVYGFIVYYLILWVKILWFFLNIGLFISVRLYDMLGDYM